MECKNERRQAVNDGERAREDQGELEDVSGGHPITVVANQRPLHDLNVIYI